MKMLFLLGFLSLNAFEYTSQFGQDKFVHETFFAHKKGGVYVDIGAHDGKTGSNTYFFEKELKWFGICFEPLPHLFKKLQECRDCICINACVSSIQGVLPFLHVDSVDEMLSGLCGTYDSRALSAVMSDMERFGGEFKILQLPCVRLGSILEQYDITYIDFLSLDTEGCELEILKTIDFEKITIHVITVENNYGQAHIKNFLESKNYCLVTRLGVDEVYEYVS